MVAASCPPFFTVSLLASVVATSMAFGQLDPTRVTDAVSRPSGPTIGQSQNLSALGLDEQNDFAPPSPGDSDIGQQLILKEVPKNRWFRAYADAFGYWTNNAANTSIGEVDDWFWGGRVGFGYQPRIAKKLFADIDVQQQLYRYDKFDALDFESLDASAGLLYIEPKLASTIFFVQGNYNRISNDDFGNELLNSVSIRAGAQKLFLIDRRNSIQLTIMGDWDVYTDLDRLERHEYIGDVTYRFKIMRDLVFALNYRYVWLDYRQVDRGDSLNIIGGSLTWSPKKWIDVYATSNFSFNDSDIDAFDYETTTLGGGVGLKIKF
jgi:Putative beta-barrel porin 2